MEGERRKRKIENEEENEEQKMERFFALIKRTKDVRDRLYKENKKMDGEREKSIWNPKFEVEDFIDCGQIMPESGKASGSHHHDLAGPSNKELRDEKKEDLQDATQLVPTEEQNGEEKDKRSEHLDLNLSL
ncbi:protein NIM1-INTERACTING 1-like [Vigna unguiculata]|uniref:NIM1-interacting protein 1/3 n=1 Tax=Vigna unguiculata TaxID=3917 RepID=A0A4D6MAH0_VIGUN|nr:protein NIM1-INTERACTING 1-like [Vigna unguiculata]QCD98399.1 NIM1-interacting protein 1/3 [Vigna unguiculata]